MLCHVDLLTFYRQCFLRRHYFAHHIFSQARTDKTFQTKKITGNSKTSILSGINL